MESIYKGRKIYYPNPSGERGAHIRRQVERGRSSLRYFLGNDERRSRFFEGTANDDRVIALALGGETIGYAAFFLSGRGPLSPTFSKFLAEYGFLKGIGNFLLFKATEPRVGASTLYIYNINVLPEHRGQGGGGALIDAAVAVAASMECKSVALQVAAHNRAMMLYLRKGFTVTGAIRAGWARRFFPFSCLVSMEMQLDPVTMFSEQVILESAEAA